MKTILSFLFKLWIIIQKCFFVIVVCFIGYYALAINDQGQDLILSMGDLKASHIIKLQICTVLWSISLWYCSRLLLLRAELGHYSAIGIESFIKWMPRIFSMLPFLILSIAIINVVDTFYNNGIFLITILTLVVEAVLTLIWFSFRRNILQRAGVTLLPNPFQAGSISLKELLQLKWFRVFFIIWAASSSILFIAFLASSQFALCLKPGAVLLLGLCLLTVVLSIMSFVNNWNTMPVFVFFFLWTGFCALFNDNTSIRTVCSSSKIISRDSIRKNFESWVKCHEPKVNNDSVTVPMIFIATQGGGIRAMYWTAAVLAHLDSTYAGFTEHTYAISGVSGGGVGAIFYLTYYKDSILNQEKLRKDLPMTMNRLTTGDFLSPVTSAFLFCDNLQKILPMPILYFNRTRWLEDSWQDYYQFITTKNSLDKSFLSLWNLPDSQKYQMPSLLINGTIAETGQKIITTNLVLDTMHFHDVVDLESALGDGTDVPLKTAASLCSRFPVITSSGLYSDSSNKPRGHIVDGGYAENTGIESMLSLYASVHQYIKQHNKTKNSFKIRPVLIFIKNSKEETKTKVIKAGLETKAPLNAFFNAWGRRAPITSQLASDMINSDKKDTLYFKIELDRSDTSVHLPLGWYLSDTAKEKIKKEAAGIFKENNNKSVRSVLSQILK